VTRADGYCFEHYPPAFAKDSRLFIYFAVKPAHEENRR
jgi:hypothetical protein